jgi:hypothetical protein
MDFARIVVALNHKVTNTDSNLQEIKDHRNITHVAHTMRMAGFVTRNNTDDEMMYHYAQLVFDSDEESVRRGYSIPQVRQFIYFDFQYDRGGTVSNSYCSKLLLIRNILSH